MAAADHPGFEVPDDTVIWRYMPLNRFESLLGDGLRFAAAAEFPDHVEGAISAGQAARQAEHQLLFDPEHVSELFKDLRRVTMVSCWHALEHENAAMWDRYRSSGTCSVAIRSTVGALKRSLRPFRLEPHYGEETIVIVAVRYVSYDEGPGPSIG